MMQKKDGLTSPSRNDITNRHKVLIPKKPPIVRHPSSNFNNRPKGVMIEYIIIHYTALPNTKAAIHWLTDPIKEVSSHYLICRTGKTYQLVEDEKRAWHAGISQWDNRENLNNYSIGIELDHDGNPNYAYTSSQIKKLITLLKYLCYAYKIPKKNVIGHCDIAPTRKIDPGNFFPWNELLMNGFGFEPSFSITNKPIKSLQEELKKIGYALKITGILDDLTKACLKAYISHMPSLK